MAKTQIRDSLDSAKASAQLHVALDNMPGALVYTDDDLNIVFCNDRFKEMYPVPQELLRSGRPYPDFLRYLAEHGYYGAGDADAQVARRVESLRNPTGKSFEDSDYIVCSCFVQQQSTHFINIFQRDITIYLFARPHRIAFQACLSRPPCGRARTVVVLLSGAVLHRE